MLVVRAETVGFCFGVRDALRTACAVSDPAGVTVLGELVHNEAVLVRLDELGFSRQEESDRDRLPATDRVLLTAHGVGETTRRRLEAAGKTLIDTTCPLVRAVHQAARALADEGRHVLILGRHGHVEVRGVAEDLPDCSVIEEERDVRTWPHTRLSIVCQSTTPPRIANALRAAIAARNPKANIRFEETICRPTRDRQEAVERLAARVDLVVVVGGSNSHNTRQLAELVRARGVPVRLVRNAEDLLPEWFVGVETVGLASGTSTDDDTLDAVEAALRRLPGPCGARRRPWTAAEWSELFRATAALPDRVPWESGAGVSREELERIVPSLRGWQLGETSEGGHLLRAARRYAAARNDPAFVETARLFIAEEQRHGAQLGRFLDLAEVPRARFDWGDSLFRAARYAFPSMETWALPVLIIETHALLYYDAIRRATGSPVLRALCERILSDEVDHIRFQAERLAILRRGRSRPLKWLTTRAQQVLATVVLAAVWIGHRGALRSGGFDLKSYRAAVSRRLRFAWRLADPEAYLWNAESVEESEPSTTGVRIAETVGAGRAM